LQGISDGSAARRAILDIDSTMPGADHSTPSDWLVADIAWQSLAELSSDLLVLLDAHGRIAWANRRFDGAAIHGCPLAEVVGDGSLAWARVHAALQHGHDVPTTELDWRGPKGERCHGRLTARAIGATGVAVTLQQQALPRASIESANEQLRLAVDLGNLAVWRHDLKSNRIHFNEQADRVLDITSRREGLALEEVRARVHPDDLQRVLDAARSALESALPVDVEARFRRSDGSWRHVLTRRVARRDADGTPQEIVGVSLDVTDRTERSRSAVELSQRLEIATHAAGLGIFSRDVATEEGEWNAEMFRITGRDPALGVPSRDEWVQTIVHPDDHATTRLAREALLESPQGHHEQQYRIIRPDGDVRWVMNRARRVLQDGHVKIYGITIDITDRVHTENALRRANERVALTARSVGMGTWELDPASGETTWDDAMFRLRGLEPQVEAPTADERRTMVHPDDREFVEQVLRDAVAGSRSAAYEFRVVWPDGTVRWLASRSSPLPGTDGRSKRYIGINWDITERVQAESERHERVLAQRESEAKSRFLARMSHELRTPLNAVLGFAQLLQLDDGSSTPGERRHRVDHIRSAGEHLLSLINEVLDLSSLDTGQVRLEFKPVPMRDVVSEALPLVTPMAESYGVRLVTGPIEGVAWGDRTRLRQVLINLLSNAVKYNRRGGQAHIETRCAGARVLLTVSDTGRGLSAEQRGHLFEPFNRLGIESEGIEGTGIGLAIVKALIDRMHGSIAVRSEPGIGSSFEVSLPRPDPSRAAATPAPEPAASLARIQSSGQLLYIEDNPINVMVVEELVASRSGLRIVSESSGEQGVARALALRPDLILVDMQLPDIDGFEVLRRLRLQPETAATPCVVLSANAMPDNIARALQAGFAGYWTKPIDFSGFLASIENLLTRESAA
jgi:PAS domain S-box-containing protein